MPCCLDNLSPDVPGDHGGRPEAPQCAGDVEKGLVERERLHIRRDRAEDRHDLLGGGGVRPVPGRETNTARGHIRSARPTGIAECTPNARAWYDADSTTPRPLVPPTMTGWPASSGRSSISTLA